MIGPELPAHLLAKRSTTPDDGPEEAGPSQPAATIGPVIPSDLPTPQAKAQQDDEDDEDDYVPELPPDLAASRAESSSKRVQGPSFPGAPPRRAYDEDDEDEDVGPMPLPAGYVLPEKDAVTEFMEKEERRRKQAEVRACVYTLPARFEVVKVPV